MGEGTEIGEVTVTCGVAGIDLTNETCPNIDLNRSIYDMLTYETRSSVSPSKSQSRRKG